MTRTTALLIAASLLVVACGGFEDEAHQNMMSNVNLNPGDTSSPDLTPTTPPPDMSGPAPDQTPPNPCLEYTGFRTDQVWSCRAGTAPSFECHFVLDGASPTANGRCLLSCIDHFDCTMQQSMMGVQEFSCTTIDGKNRSCTLPPN